MDENTRLKPLPIGVDNFEKLITRGYYFIDKTLLIKELLDKKEMLICLPSPPFWQNTKHEHAPIFL